MRLSQCPECHSSNIKFYEVRNSYNCIDCGCSFSEKEINKLRIFLSYGHDDNEELVRLIKTDLEKRGHDVWFDKNEIKFGDEWRRSITDGILGSNRVLSFLSKYSTRDPGVCRDEIAIAIGVKGGNIQTILVESEQEVQPPVSIGHIQWLDMHDWQEKRTDDGAAWEPWYQTKLAEIISVVESDESRRFAGEIEKLNDYLKPIKSDSRISGLLSKGFYGREWLFDAVENWRQDTTHDSRLFWIMGDPGVGKSAFAAQLTHTHGDTVIAAQFCEWDKPDHRDARRVVCSIAFQLATRLPDYRKLLLTLPEIKELDRKDASELFDYLLANPIKSVINGGRERHLIVIDALDEAGESGRNPLVEMLARNAHHLPDWLGIVVTSRPEFDVKTPFQALNPFPLDTKSESNPADIRDYMESKLALQLQNRPNTEKLIAQILEKSEGVFLYVERFCDDVQQKHISLDLPDQFPQGLGGIFAQYFQRQFPDLEKFRKEIRPALRAILAAREPLPLEILQKLFNWQDEELNDFTHSLGSLFPVTKTTDSETIKPYHKSLADWLGDEAKSGSYFVSEMEGHRMLAEFGCNQMDQSLEMLSTYFFIHLPAHLIFLKQWNELVTLLCREDYGNLAKSRHLTQDTLIINYQNTLKNSPTIQRNRLWAAPLSCSILALKAIGRTVDFGEYKDAKILIEQCAEFVSTRKLPELTNSWNCLAGRIAIYEGDRNEAELRLSEALNIARDAGNKEGVAKALLGIGISLRKFGNSYTDAQETLSTVLTYDFSSFDKDLQARVMLNLSMLYICKSNVNDAEVCLNKAEILIEEFKNQLLESWLHKYKGFLFLLRQEFIKAIESFRLAGEMFSRQGYLQEQIRCEDLLYYASVPICWNYNQQYLEKNNYNAKTGSLFMLKEKQLKKVSSKLYDSLVSFPNMLNESEVRITADKSKQLISIIQELEQMYDPEPPASMSINIK